MAETKDFGVTISWDPAGGTSFANIPGLAALTPPNQTIESIETTDSDTTGTSRTYIPQTLSTPEEMSFTVHYDTASAVHDAAAGLQYHFAQRTEDIAWRITWPDTETWTFAGFISAINKSEYDAQSEQMIKLEVSVMPAGAVTVA